MIVIAAAVFGALTGTGVARRRGGRGLDQAQYAAGYGIAFAIVGAILTIVIDRML